ncbi:hypothetical protein [Streptomyces doebereineriae]|uniref:Uncharacterized protein n=1 Tax=Streptomyces doebereineriae TaxID=3075528 RepID=A0ABU2VBW0_9ACTN|nr:hypothetical protein [Streptomyces sp. DSM 41640]MDT0482656.1 hypothetical protein [Streptomyces sp. DSM 41640]
MSGPVEQGCSTGPPHPAHSATTSTSGTPSHGISRTPPARPGLPVANVKCVPYAKWVQAWTEIKG